MTSQRLKLLVTAVLGASLLLSACSSRDTQPEETTAATTQATEAKTDDKADDKAEDKAEDDKADDKASDKAEDKSSEEADSKAGTVEITDQRDKTVAVPQPVNKVAFAVIPAPAIMAAVDGSWDKIVGINESTLKANKSGIIGKAYPEATSTTTIASSNFIPNIETLLQLDPDLVVQWGDREDDVITAIEKAGFPTLGLKYGTQADLEKWITMFSQAIGKEERGKQIIDNMNKEADDIRAAVKGFNKPKPRVVSLSYTPDALKVTGKSSYDSHIFEIVNAENVAAEADLKEGIVGPEQFIQWNPEVIFLSAFQEAVPDDVYKDPRFKDIDAVKNKRVYRTPIGFYRWQVPCAESSLFYHWVASLAYPEDYKIDMRQKMIDQEKFLYNYDLTDEDIAQVLRTDLNSGSAHYDQLSK